MGDLGNTIKARLSELDKTQGWLAEQLNVSNNAVSKWISTGKISRVNAVAAARVLSISLESLLDGASAGASAGAANDRPEIEKLVPGARPVRAVADDDPALTKIKKVKLKVQAGITGFQTEAEEYEGDTQGVPTKWLLQNGLARDSLLAVVVRGESMEPALYEGDVIVVNTRDVKPVDGAVYVVNYEGEAVVKRLIRDAGQWWLSSDNADQRKYHRKLCKGAECILIGRVIRKESTHI